MPSVSQQRVRRRGQCGQTLLVVVGSMLVFSMAASQAAFCQSTRTWVSVNGNDANACDRATPCRTLAGALAKTSAGGEVDVLDSGDFGSVTLNKTVSVIAPGVIGGIQAGSGTAITINAGPTDRVVLRGLTIDGIGQGVTGVSFVAGGALHIENCTINNFSSYGVLFSPTSNGSLFITDGVVRNNGAAGSGGGVLVKPSGSGSVKAVLSGVTVEDNNFGVRAEGTSSTGSVNVSVQGGSVSGNVNSGTISVAQVGVAVTQMLVSGTTISNNGTGVRADGAVATLRFGNTDISGNGTGMSTSNGGQLLSYATNHVDGNTVDGLNPPTIPTK
jgi:hypothetical protein